MKGIGQRALLLLFVFGLGMALTSHSSTFATDATPVITPPISTYAFSGATDGDVYEFVITLPFNGQTLDKLTVTWDSAPATNNLPTFTGLTTSSTVSWTWAFATGDTTSSLKVVSTAATTGTYFDTGEVLVYYITIIKNGVPIHSTVDIARTNIVRYIYSSVDQTVTTSVDIGGTANSEFIHEMSTMRSDNQFLGSAAFGTSTTAMASYAFNNVLPGYYIYFLENSPTTTSSTYNLNHQTDPYQCPYISGFTDTFNVFLGCTPTSAIPFCVHTNTDGTCASCSPGYALISGKCGTPFQLCGARKYASNGTCHDVSSTCNTFDAFSGKCYKCLDPAVDPDSKGVCAVSAAALIVCAAGTHEYNLMCIPDECSAADSTGKCTSCVNTAYLLDSATGKCNPVDCGTGRFFSVANAGCTVLPSKCAKVNLITQKCIECISAHFLHPLTNACEKPIGSENCITWNFLTLPQKCDRCQDGYIWELNKCRLTGASKVPCPAGKILVGVFCIHLPPFCKSLNKYYHCSQCTNGYRLEAGDCVKCTGNNPLFPCVTCPADRVIDNLGRCVFSSSNNGPQTPVNPDVYYQFCRIYNPTSKLCEDCIAGYKFDFADHCAL